MNQDISKQSAIKFVVLLGLVSLFADMTYEAARSITGPYLAVLGGNAAVVGFVAGFGELIGYTLRLFSGYLSDKTKQYWGLTIFGYIINLMAVPLLALAGHWWVASCLIITERIGKALRVPPRDAMLSHATHEMGRGWGFGIHEAMDQIGALLGPIIVILVLFFKGGYKESFAILLIPALLAISILVIAKLLYPNPHDLEPKTIELKTKGFSKIFWLYVTAIGLIAAGYADFPLIAFHFKKISVVPDIWIPIFYAVAMGVDAIAALILGRLFDKIGIIAMVLAAFIASLFAPFVFLGGFYLALVGMIIWGIGMGAQESIMRATVAGLVSANKRATAYGVFSTGYGICWFLGSALMGILYDISLPALIIFSVSVQLLSIPILFLIHKRGKLAI
ncbi:MAG: MFS transporter [Candidatus Gastranaerophilales bacterium]|nr:MFS transporter [Candidatus Gastranaerophilales bacterium]